MCHGKVFLETENKCYCAWVLRVLFNHGPDRAIMLRVGIYPCLLTLIDTLLNSNSSRKMIIANLMLSYHYAYEGICVKYLIV